MTHPRVLLVEDETTKISEIVACLTANGLTSDDIDIARCGSEARAKLSTKAYDLLITDLMIPLWNSGPPQREGGLDLLRDLIASDQYKLPSSVIGLTQYDDLQDGLTEEFQGMHWSLDLYNPGEQGWRDRLGARTRYLVRAHLAAKQKGYSKDIAIVTALPLELRAVRNLPWNWSAAENLDEGTYVYEGALQEGSNRFTSVAACTPRMGMVAAALLATKMILEYRPKLLVMCGICAGVGGECGLGDILLADPCWDYQSGKLKKKAKLISPDQIDVALEIRQRFDQLSENMTALQDIHARFTGGKRPDAPPKILIGPVASGSAVLADDQTIKMIKDTQHRALIGVEMEQYGVYSAAKDAGLPRPRVFGIKSVVDFGSSTKDSEYQPFGAYASAEVLQLFMRKYGAELLAMQ